MTHFIKAIEILVTGLIAMAMLTAPEIRAHDSGPEFIESFETRLEIGQSGDLAIRHVIDVHPHGEEIRRGLFFELPDHIGPLSGFFGRLEDEPIELEFEEGAVIVAASEPLATQQSHRFTLGYHADAPWSLEEGGSALLRWTPLIAQFELAWRDAELSIRWPENVQLIGLPEHGTANDTVWSRLYRGPLYEDESDPSIERVELRAAASSIAPESLRRWGHDWALRAFLATGMLGLLVFLHTGWRAVGRDPDPGSISIRRSPPDGLSPPATRFVDRMGFDQTTFVTALVSLRVKQMIDIDIDADKETLAIRRKRSSVQLPPGEEALIEVLFEDQNSIELGPSDKRAVEASKALKTALGKEHRGRHFVLNSAYRNWGIALGLLLSFASIAAMILQARDHLTPDRWVVGLGFTGLLIGVVAPVVYFELFKAPTRAGTVIKGQIDGLRRYFTEDQAPIADARHFVELLPYATALESEQAWRDRFDRSDESGLDQETAEGVAWYREIQRRHDSTAAIVTIVAGATASHTASATAGGGASAGGV